MNLSGKVKFTFAWLAVTMVISSYRPVDGNNSGPRFWEKTVTREIVISPNDMSAKAHKGIANDNVSLTETIVDALKAGKLSAYANQDLTLSTKLTEYELGDIFDRQETGGSNVTVAAHSKEKVIRRGINYKHVHRYRILERWTFDPGIGKTEIRIIGIAPVREVYSSDGNFLGVQAVFWLRYNEARPLLDDYEMKHPKYNITQLIWDDYFANKMEPQLAATRTPRRVTRIIDMQAKEDRVIHHFRDINDNTADTTLTELIEGGIRSGGIEVFPPGDFSLDSGFSTEEIKTMFGPWVDTVKITDPVTEIAVTKLLTHLAQNHLHKYRFLENWTIDATNGKTEIQVVGVSPVTDVHLADGVFVGTKSVYLVKFSQIKRALTRYDQLNPEHTIASFIWNDYFLSDVRPEIQN